MWQPQQEGVEQIAELLREYTKPNCDQKLMFKKLQECSQFPDFNSYLALILTKDG